VAWGRAEACTLHPKDATPVGPHSQSLPLMQAGDISEPEMFRTFNMGIGMVLVVRPGDADTVRQLESSAVVLGKVVQGEGVQF